MPHKHLTHYTIFINNLPDKDGVFTSWLQQHQYSRIFVLCDENTAQYCYPKLQAFLPKHILLQIKSGESEKNIDTCTYLWQQLTEYQAERKSLLINLGGGVIGDMGGFVAGTYKRGFDFINIPTTLLAMIDAAVGGKTGINFNGLKNEIGVINPSKSVLIDTQFLQTLDKNNLLSGYAEMIKHALIFSEEELRNLFQLDFDEIDYHKLNSLVQSSIQIKENIVLQDPNEQGLRKALNFGHTIGHAFESFSYKKNQPALHGYAVAWGMVCELYLSYKYLGFPKEIMMQVVDFVKVNYRGLAVSCKDYDCLYELMLHDKKNTVDKVINFTLLSGIGQLSLNQNIEKEAIFDSLDFYREMMGM